MPTANKFQKIYIDYAKITDKYIKKNNLKEGRRVIAKYEAKYQVIIPIGPVTSVSYYTPRHKEEQQAKAGKNAFDGILKKQMQELEEGQTFQAYC